MREKVSFFMAGLIIGILIATVGFSFFLKAQNGAQDPSDPGSNSPAAKVVLKLGHSLDTNHPVHKGMEFMRDRLEEISGGTVTIDIHPSSVLGSETQCIEQLQNGALAMTKTSTASIENFVPELSVFGLPYIFRDNEHHWKVLKSPIGQSLLTKGESKFLRGLCYYAAGSRNFYTIKKPIKHPDDLKGMKIRVMNSKTAMDMVRAMGGAPTPIAWGELYSSLAQNVVDGAENNPPSFTSNKHYEVCKHFSLDGHTYIPDMLMISTKIWDKLSSQVKEWVMQAAIESSDFQRKLWDEKTLECLDQARAEGVTIHTVDIAPFAEKVQPMLDAVENKEVKALLKRIKEVN